MESRLLCQRSTRIRGTPTISYRLRGSRPRVLDETLGTFINMLSVNSIGRITSSCYFLFSPKIRKLVSRWSSAIPRFCFFSSKHKKEFGPVASDSSEQWTEGMSRYTEACDSSSFKWVNWNPGSRAWSHGRQHYCVHKSLGKKRESVWISLWLQLPSSAWHHGSSAESLKNNPRGMMPECSAKAIITAVIAPLTGVHCRSDTVVPLVSHST